jgi:hypothetical protein
MSGCNVFVEDNFLTQSDFKELQANIFTVDVPFPWSLSPILIHDEDGIPYGNTLKDGSFNLMMSHLFYTKSMALSHVFDMMNPILTKLDPVALLRGKINLYFGTERQSIHGYHVDNNLKNCTTCVYFLNTNNGKLYFKDGTAIDSVENRIVLFDSRTFHSSSTCTDQPYRCTININYIDRRGLIDSVP